MTGNGPLPKGSAVDEFLAGVDPFWLGVAVLGVAVLALVVLAVRLLVGIHLVANGEPSSGPADGTARQRCLWCGRGPGARSRRGWTRLDRRYRSVAGDPTRWVCPDPACLSRVVGELERRGLALPGPSSHPDA